MAATARALTTRTSTIVSARRKPGAEDRIVGQVLTKTAKGEGRVGFSASAADGAALLDLVGKTVDVESRYCGRNVLVITGVLPAAGEPLDERSTVPEHVTTDALDRDGADEPTTETFAGCTLLRDEDGLYTVTHDTTGYREDSVAGIAAAREAAKDISRAVTGRFRA